MIAEALQKIGFKRTKYNDYNLVLLNGKRFNEWKEGLSPERVDKHFYKGWYWRSLNLTTREDRGFYHHQEIFLKYLQSMQEFGRSKT